MAFEQVTLSSNDQKKLSDLKTLADLLDAKYEGPFGIRIGWDGIIGLIPGFGAIITTLLSGLIVLQSVLLGAPFVVIVRMILNIFVDDFIGAIPLFGWVGDFFWKSNLKNIQLLQGYIETPEKVTRHTRFMIGGLAFLTLTVIFGLIVAVTAVSWILFTYLLSAVTHLLN